MIQKAKAEYARLNANKGKGMGMGMGNVAGGGEFLIFDFWGKGEEEVGFESDNDNGEQMHQQYDCNLLGEGGPERHKKANALANIYLPNSDLRPRRPKIRPRGLYAYAGIAWDESTHSVRDLDI